jgi:hypothetical protein
MPLLPYQRIILAYTCWGYLYPASKQWIENAKDWINKRP